MAESSKSVTIHQRVPIQVSLAGFKTFDSARYADIERLKAVKQARIEVGYFETGCCKRLVHAVVKKGMVTKLDLERCKHGVAAPPEFSELVQKAAKQLGLRKAGAKKLPMPVESAFADIEALTIHVWGCISICAFGYCLLCCYDIGVGKPWGMCAIRSTEVGLA
jgi:hypothetical protein